MKNYNDFIYEVEKLNHNELIDEIKRLNERITKLERELYGKKMTIKNLEEKLFKRNDRYCGEVWDKDSRKRANR